MLIFQTVAEISGISCIKKKKSCGASARGKGVLVPGWEFGPGGCLHGLISAEDVSSSRRPQMFGTGFLVSCHSDQLATPLPPTWPRPPAIVRLCLTIFFIYFFFRKLADQFPTSTTSSLWAFYPHKRPSLRDRGQIKAGVGEITQKVKDGD